MELSKMSHKDIRNELAGLKIIRLGNQAMERIYQLYTQAKSVVCFWNYSLNKTFTRKENLA